MRTKTEESLKKAAQWIRAQMRDRTDGRSHPSHAAARILREADEKFALNSHGVEGWANDTGRSGVQYLNFGDAYEPTIVVRTSPHRHSVHVALGGWAGYA